MANLAILSGRLTSDPEIRVTQSGTKVANYTLAVDGIGKDAQASFIRCTTFDKAADFTERYMHKGMKMLVQGRIVTGSYTDKNGNKVNTTTVNVSNQEFCESKGNSNDAPSAPNAAASFDGFVNVPMGVEDEGLPFC